MIVVGNLLLSAIHDKYIYLNIDRRWEWGEQNHFPVKIQQ